MIRVLRLDNTELIINAELVEIIEAKPDTIITLTTGRKILTKNSVDEVIAKIINYQKAIRSESPTQVERMSDVRHSS